MREPCMENPLVVDAFPEKGAAGKVHIYGATRQPLELHFEADLLRFIRRVRFPL